MHKSSFNILVYREIILSAPKCLLSAYRAVATLHWVDKYFSNPQAPEEV